MTLLSRFLAFWKSLFGGATSKAPALPEATTVDEDLPTPEIVDTPDQPQDLVDDPNYDVEHETEDDNTPRDPLPDPDPDTLERVDREMVSVDPWKERQQWLKDLGYDPGPIDGKLGKRTTAAVQAFQMSQGLVADGIWGPKTDAAVRKALRDKSLPASAPAPPVLGLPKFEDMLEPADLDDDFWVCFEDLTSKSNVQDEQGRRRRKGVRKISNLVREVWHQTSFTWKPYRELKATKRYSSHHKINAHACFDTDGPILLLHPLTSYLWTANAYNVDCLSFELMGNFEGILGTGNWYKPDKFGRARPKRIQLLRARQFTTWLLDPEQGPPDDQLPEPLLEWRLGVRKLGRNPIKWANAHRQGTDDRDLDCGSESWYHIVRWTVETFEGMSVGPEKGRGEKIPPEWLAKPIAPPVT